MKSMGPVTACLYALIMAYAYGSEIIKLYEVKDATSLSFQWIGLALIAVLLRVATVGLAIKEVWNKAQVRSISNIALAISEIVVIIGLLIILYQMFLYNNYF